MFRRFHKCLMVFLILPTLVGVGNAAVEYPQVKASITPSDGAVGDRFLLTLSIVAPEIDRVSLKEGFGNEKGTTWTLIDKKGSPDEKLNATEWRRTVQYEIAPFEVGELTTPQIEVTYSPQGRQPRTKEAPPQTVKIRSELPPNAGTVLELKAPKPPVKVPFPAWVFVLIGLVAAAFLGLAGFLLVRRLRRRIEAIISPPKPLDVWALEELALIEQSNLIEQKKTKEYYTRLSDTVRAYAGRLFKVNALDLTTHELLMVLGDARGGSLAITRMQPLLDEADLVKFARYVPDPSVCRKALEQARGVVESTRCLLDVQEEEAQGGTPSESSGSFPGAPGDPSDATRTGEVGS